MLQYTMIFKGINYFMMIIEKSILMTKASFVGKHFISLTASSCQSNEKENLSNTKVLLEVQAKKK